MSFNGQAINVRSAEQGSVGEAGGANTGQRGSALQQLGVETVCAFGRIAAEAGVERDQEDAVGLEAGVEILEVSESADKKAGADQEDQGHGDLCGNQQISQTQPPAIAHGNAFVLQGRSQVRPDCLEGGNDADQSGIVAATRADAEEEVGRGGAKNATRPDVEVEPDRGNADNAARPMRRG